MHDWWRMSVQTGFFATINITNKHKNLKVYLTTYNSIVVAGNGIVKLAHRVKLIALVLALESAQLLLHAFPVRRRITFTTFRTASSLLGALWPKQCDGCVVLLLKEKRVVAMRRRTTVDANNKRELMWSAECQKPYAVAQERFAFLSFGKVGLRVCEVVSLACSWRASSLSLSLL